MQARKTSPISRNPLSFPFKVKNNNLAAKAQGERLLRSSMVSSDPHMKHRFQGLNFNSFFHNFYCLLVFPEAASSFFASALMSNPSDPQALYRQASLVLEQVSHEL